MQHGDNGPDLFDGAGSLDASLASSSVVSSQLSHAEKVDVMGGGFRLQPPHERFESQAAMPPKSAPITKQMMKKGGGRDALMMKQKIQREGTVGRLQPMLPVPGNNQSVIIPNHILFILTTCLNIYICTYKETIYKLQRE